MQILVRSQPERFALEEGGVENMDAEDRPLFLFEDAEGNVQVHFQSARMARAFAATSSARVSSVTMARMRAPASKS